MIQCSTTGGEYIPPTRYSYDANESLRSKAAEACLYRKGWQKISSEEYEARKPKLMTPSNLQVPERTKSEGSSCITASECAGNLLCLGGVCSYFKKAGELCNHTQQCEGKLQCNNGRCAMPETVAKPKLLEGSSCISTDECQSGLQCQLGRCRIPQTKHLGQPCNSTTECIGDTLCITGRCALRGKIGNDCKFTYECEGALQCKSGKCTSN